MSAEATEQGAKADVAQLAERVLGKDEVTSSILVIGSSLRREQRTWTQRIDDNASEDRETWPKKNSIAANRT